METNNKGAKIFDWITDKQMQDLITNYQNNIDIAVAAAEVLSDITDLTQNIVSNLQSYNLNESGNVEGNVESSSNINENAESSNSIANVPMPAGRSRNRENAQTSSQTEENSSSNPTLLAKKVNAEIGRSSLK